MISDVPPELAERSLRSGGARARTELAGWAARGSPTAIAESKRAMWSALEMPMSQSLQSGYERVLRHCDHPDATEGPAAFAVKREPRWET